MPCFLGADGVKLLKSKDKTADYKYLYYALCNAKIPNTGYNRHFKWLKEVEIPMPDVKTQKQIVSNLDKVTNTIDLCNAILEKLDLLVKSRLDTTNVTTNRMRTERRTYTRKAR
ncbi:MAG: restriction endonuclease subunit S [Oscillospiraceae bacterium]|nr:restriction endonuclease subunit S [Oscillospiraceae bacterium]